MNFKRGLATGVIAAAMAAGVPAIAQAVPSSDSGLHKVGDVATDAPVYSQEDLLAFVQSSTPKTAVQDVKTGQFSKVTVGESVSPMIVSRIPCSATDLCLRPTQTPYANYGFYGAGTTSGTWSNRASWYTGSWSGRVKTSNGVWSGVAGPHTTVLFSQVPITVTGVEIK